MTDEDRAVLIKLPEHAILALTAFLEARNQPVQGIVAVMYSVINRMKIGTRGKTIAEVCYWPWQYSCWNTGDPNLTRGSRIAMKLIDGESLEIESDLIVFQTCIFLADRILDRLNIVREQVLDPSFGATHYYNPQAVEKSPDWADPKTGSKKTKQIGQHMFFKSVAM